MQHLCAKFFIRVTWGKEKLKITKSLKRAEKHFKMLCPEQQSSEKVKHCKMLIIHQGSRGEMPSVIFHHFNSLYSSNKACWASRLDPFRWLSVCTWFPHSPDSKQKIFAATQGEAFGFNKENLRLHFHGSKNLCPGQKGHEQLALAEVGSTSRTLTSTMSGSCLQQERPLFLP